MRRWLAVLLVFALAAAAGCGGEGKLAPATVRVSGVYGSTAEGVSAKLDSDQLVLSFALAPEDGQFIAVSLPGARAITNETWTGAEHVLHLAVPVAKGLEVGVYPLAGYSGAPFAARITLDTRPRAASIPPLGPRNVVNDLVITELPAGKVQLEWTERNWGDYTVDGIVNVSDMVPIGTYYGWTSSSPGWNVAKVADGNGDGSVDVKDLTAIGTSWQSVVAGYFVKHGPQGAAPPLPVVAQLSRDDFMSPSLPLHYSIVLPGTFDDEWAVAPFDRDGIEGTGSQDVVVDRIDLRSSMSYAGSDLWSLDGSAFGPLAADSYVMRAIDPGDEPSRTPIVPPIIGPLGVTLFDDLPRQQRLMADFVYAPVVDPVTGAPAPYTSQWITSVPFVLPASDQQLQIDAAIQLTARDGGGYYIDFRVTQNLLGAPEVLLTRLDPAAYLVACDTTHDWTPEGGGFGDEAWLSDSDRDGVSDALLLRQIEYNTYHVYGTGELQPVLVSAVVTQYSESDGRLVLADAIDGITGLPEPMPDSPILMRFSEQTSFSELVNPGPNQFERHFDPSMLHVGDEVLVHGVRLVDPTTVLQFKYWADRILRKVQQ